MQMTTSVFITLGGKERRLKYDINVPPRWKNCSVAVLYSLS